MRDPVTGFDYPAEWVARCTGRDKLPLVEQGLAVLTSSGSVLRRGFTTGTTAAAACKDAVLTLKGVNLHVVTVWIPCDLVVDVPVEACEGRASAIKFSGDYPDDVTQGLEFIAHAVPGKDELELIVGDGIGGFTRNAPRFKKGMPAISPPAFESIVSAIQVAMECTGITGVQVTLSVPRGTETAKKTLNSRVGVEGGISILGTTGLVEPWDDHLTESNRERIAIANVPVLTTGRIGLRFSRLQFPDREVILIGGKITDALAAANGDVILCGLPALILRHIDPHILDGTGFCTVEEFTASPGFPEIACRIVEEFRNRNPNVRVVLFNRDGTILVESP